MRMANRSGLFNAPKRNSDRESRAIERNLREYQELTRVFQVAGVPPAEAGKLAFDVVIGRK